MPCLCTLIAFTYFIHEKKTFWLSQNIWMLLKQIIILNETIYQILLYIKENPNRLFRDVLFTAVWVPFICPPKQFIESQKCDDYYTDLVHNIEICDYVLLI